MGEANRKRAEFFRAHPNCCFCGGKTPATTRDHVPNRATFPGRQAPEGYEFPACANCQHSTRLDEIAFSALVYFLADDPDVPEPAQAQRIIRGLVNNLPHLARIQQMTANEKRRAVRELDINHPGGAFSNLSMVKIPTEWHRYVERYLAKIARALFYKHLGRAVPADWVVWSQWTYDRIGANREALKEWIEMTPIVEVGRRSNVDLGERFVYRVNFSDEMGAFAAVGRFGRGLIFYATILEPGLADRLNTTVKARIDQQR